MYYIDAYFLIISFLTFIIANYKDILNNYKLYTQTKFVS